MRHGFLALDTTTKANLLHALRGPDCPLRGRRHIFLDGELDLEACFCPIQGGSDDSAPGLTSVLQDLWQQCRRHETLLFICILGICRNVSSVSLSLNIRPVSCDCLNYCLVGSIFLFFLLNNPPCISGSAKLALFCRTFADVYSAMP